MCKNKRETFIAHGSDLFKKTDGHAVSFFDNFNGRFYTTGRIIRPDG